jgi:hypothetical protein
MKPGRKERSVVAEGGAAVDGALELGWIGRCDGGVGFGIKEGRHELRGVKLLASGCGMLDL